MRKKRGWFIILILCLLSVPIASVFAESPKVDGEKERVERIKRTEAKKAELNGSEWQIEIKASGGGKGSLAGTDTLIFQDGKFSSKQFSKKGFLPTNYTLTVPESEEAATVWETMQSGPKGEIVFWRGEWSKNGMSGSVIRQLEKGNEDHNFSSTRMNKIPPTSSEEGEATKGEKEAVTVPEPPPQTPDEEQKPMKKNWFS